jgi:hypothetical protein
VPRKILLCAKPQEPVPEEFFHQWKSPQGGQWVLFYRRESNFLVRFVDLADFTVSADAQEITITPVAAVSREQVEHLYLNLVAPLALSHQNKLVLHASAIEVDDFSLVFAAPSGGGKSTLAASFASAGYRFLADDGVELRAHGATYLVQPNHPSIGLWSDSSEQLYSNNNEMITVETTPGKLGFLMADKTLFCDQPRPLKHVYFLGDGSASELSIAPVAGAEVMANILRNSFLLDVAATKSLARNFDDVSLFAQQAVFYSLDYPRRYDVLPGLHEEILDRARGD